MEFSRERAEHVNADGYAELRKFVAVGDPVLIGNGEVVTITVAGKSCDCGKGVLCSQNKREKVYGP